MRLEITFFIILSFMVQFSSEQSSGVTFQNVPSTLSLNETTPLRTNLLQINVVNNNSSPSPLRVTCSNSSSQEACDTFKFTVLSANANSWGGSLYLDKALDYTRIASYSLQLTATDDRSSSATAIIAINVLATRYRPPSFVGNNIIEIAERSSASSEPILTFSARSSSSVTSGFPIHYRILTGTFSSYFLLDEISGVLTNSRPLQTSDPLFSDSVAVLQIEAAFVIGNVPAWSNSSTSTVINATIYFTGSNLNSPTFDKPFYNGSIKETALSGTFVDTIFLTVTDLDKSLSAASFALSIDKENDKFEVKPSVGLKSVEARISLISSDEFSYNDGPRQYSFNVIAIETASPEKKSSQAAVNVMIVQVNRYAPTFFQDPYNVTISETAPADTVVVQVKAWDRDVGPIFGNESIRYRIGYTELFKMTEYGLMTVSRCRNPGVYACLDYERVDMRTIRITVYATDIKGEGLTSTALVIINLSNENDNPPIFSYNEYRGSINDNSTTLTILPAPIQATDADGDVITFSLLRDGNERNLWTINPSTGVITPVRPILYTDAPINGSFHLVIQASDGLHNVLANVVITVMPINRYPPVFTQRIYNITIPRTFQQGSTVIQVTALDQDPPTTPGGIVTYRLIAGGQDFFEVQPNTGNVILKNQLNQDNTPNFTLTIEATDHGDVPLQDTTTVIITILSVPLFLPSVDVTINDDLRPDSIVTTVSASTSVQNPDYLYTIIGPTGGFDVNMNPVTDFTNDDREMFRIEPNNGIVRVNKVLNSERIPTWRSVIQVLERSSNPILTATGTITIRMFPTNKKSPVFNPPWTTNLPVYNLTVQQGNITNPQVATFSAISPNQSLTIVYELVDPQSYFRLQAPSSGIIIQQRPFDEQMRNYSFVLIARDNGVPPLSSTATINVIINSDNLYAPVFNQSNYAVAIYENATVGSTVVQVYATDRDPGNFGIIVYSIDPSVNSSFSINPNTGLISVASTASFDAAKHPLIEFIATAVDNPGFPSQQKFANAYVRVTILDTNDHAPTFIASEFRIQILDKLSIKSFIVQALAIDGDLGRNAEINYAIVSGNNLGMFSIDSNGSIYLEKSLVGQPNQYTLNVTATDNGTPQQSSYCFVYIMVTSTCGSLCNPIWRQPSSLSTTIDVLESVPVNYVIFNLVANNYRNEAGNISYAFVSGLSRSFTNGNFRITKVGSNAANISIDNKLSYGQKYAFEVEANDTFVPGSSVSRYFIVNVLALYTLNPQFPFNNQTYCTLPLEVQLPVTTPSGSIVTKVKAVTKYATDQVTYSIMGNNNQMFYINNGTGEIYLSGTPTLGTTNITVNAKYPTFVNQTSSLCNGLYDQSNITVIINVIELVPTYNSDPINICIDNSLESGSTVLQLNNELVNNNLGEIKYSESAQNQYLSVGTGGDVNLKTSASSIRGSPLTYKVTSYFVAYPSKTAMLSIMGYTVDRVTDLTLVTLKMPLGTFLSTGKGPFMNNMNKYGAVCYVDASYHSTDEGTFNTDQTDVYIYIINRTTNAVIPPLALDQSIKTVAQRSSADIIGITGAVSRWDGFNYNPVAIAIGLIIGLLLLCLLFFCCCCIWPFIASYCMSAGENEPFIAKSMTGGIVNKDWAVNPPIHEQQHLSMDVPDTDAGKAIGHYGQDYGDDDILQADSFKSTARREDSATVDGMISNEGIQPVIPSGYVHIEAPLAPSRNASAMGATVDATKSGNAFKSVTETMLQESYERGVNQAGKTTYANQDEMTKQSLYSRSRNGRIAEHGDDEAQGPVQLNDASNMGSQIGATLIKSEPVGGLTQVQNIISGSEPALSHMHSTLPGYEYTNYSGTLVTDPSRSNMAYSNEVVFTGLRPVSHYEDMDGTLQVPRNDLTMNTINGGTRQDSRFMERFEETRFL